MGRLLLFVCCVGNPSSDPNNNDKKTKTIKNYLKYLLLLTLLLHRLASIAQEYNFINYNVQDGLPQSQVYDIFQDSKSYLWMATQGGGVAKFDGATFQTLTSKDGLPSNYINYIFEDQQNTIWFATKNGIASYDHSKINWSQKNSLKIETIAQINDSTLWLGTHQGIHALNKNTGALSKETLNRTIDRNRVNAMLKIEDKMWIATSRGVFIVNKNKAVQSLTINNGLLSNDVKDLQIGDNETIWISQFAGGLSCINVESKKILQEFNQSKLKRIQSAFLDDNTIYACTQDKGMAQYNLQDSTWTYLDESDGLSHNNVQEVFKDAWGNLWIGTSGGGVIKYLGQFFQHYNSENGLSGERIYAVEETEDGAIWLSVSDEGITLIDSTGIYTNIDSLNINTKCNDIFEDNQGRMWFSTNGEGLVMLDTLGFHNFTQADGLPSDWIQSVIQDISGYIWVGTYANGLAKIVSLDSLGLQVEVLDKKDGLSDLFVTALQTDPSGRIWVATKLGGLGYVENGRVVSVEKGSKLPKTSIRSIAFDRYGNIWLGTAGEGIYTAAYDDLETGFSKIQKHRQLTSDNIYLLIFDDESNLWAGSEVGVDKISFNNSGVVLNIQHFGKNEGFLGIETCHNAATLDSDGNLWFGTLNGLSKHKPGSTQLSIAPPKIHFKGINLMYNPIEESKYKQQLNEADSLISNTKFTYNNNDIGFEFKAIHPDDPNNLYYKWKLQGLEKDWSRPSKVESVNYTNLSAGKYQFLAKAIGKNGLESNLISTSFKIKPAIWQRKWFQLLTVILLGLLMYLFYRYRISKIEKKEAEKRAQLELKNELLGLEQKALQLQMNPHFIFNALNSIQSLVVNEKPDIARVQIQNFAGLMRGILTNSKNEKITLAEECATLDKYLKMEQFCQTVPFDFKIKMPSDFDADEIELPPMMIQPFVENSVIHGISHLKNKNGTINVDFEVKGRQLICTILDNGVGRSKSAKLNQKTKQGHQSMAMDVTQKRIKSLSKDFKNNPILIEDIKQNGEVGGTKVQLILPLEINY